MTTTQIALLRGINIGPKNRLAMPALRDAVAAAGGDDPRTYLQSGNVVFEASDKAAPGIGSAITEWLRDEHGLTVPIVLVTAGELRAMAAANPFLRVGRPESELHLMLLSAEPDPDRVAGLEPDHSPGDAFAVADRVVYLHCPNGVARSKLTNAWFDRALGVVSTSRNWRTVKALIELGASPK